MVRNLIIFDWDDTLFPTSWTVQNNIDLTKETDHTKYMIFFAKLDMLIYKLFMNCMKLGKIVIVTHATTRWVLSSSNILPNTQTLILKHIRIISASELFREKYPDRVASWKAIIFQNLVTQNNVDNILSLGDADYEFRALVNLFNQTRIIKCVRFSRSPSFDIICEELENLDNNITSIMVYNGNLEIQFE